MKTLINGKDAEWTPEIRAEWDAAMAERPPAVFVCANYYTPRPYRNEYDRGWSDRGFVYVIVREPYREVCYVKLPRRDFIGQEQHVAGVGRAIPHGRGAPAKTESDAGRPTPGEGRSAGDETSHERGRSRT